MTKKQIIAIDIDDTIADSTETLRLLVNERAGANLTPEQYRTPGDYWGYYERIWSDHGLKDKVSLDLLSQEMVIDQSHVPLLAGASFAMVQLANRFDIVLITSRHASWEGATRKWIDTHFPELEVDIYFTESHKDASAKTKGQLCKEIGAEYLVDDNVQHCQSAVEQGITGVLFGTYGWQYNAPDELIKCGDWPAVLEYFDGR